MKERMVKLMEKNKINLDMSDFEHEKKKRRWLYK